MTKLKAVDSEWYAQFTKEIGQKVVDDTFKKEDPKELEAKYTELLEQIAGTDKPKGFWATITEKEPKAKRISFEQRMQSFLAGYESKLTKLTTIIIVAEEQLEGLKKWRDVYKASIENVELTDLDGLEQIDYTERVKIINTQELTIERSQSRIRDSKGTQLIMSSSLSRYRTDLSTAISEIGMARVLDSALTTLGVFEKLSGDTQDKLTEGVIKSNWKTIDTCQKVLASDNATGNRLKLSGAIKPLILLNTGKWTKEKK